MITNVENNIVRVVILDISGVYVQIHDQGYFNKETLEDIKQKYSDTNNWLVIVLD